MYPKNQSFVAPKNPVPTSSIVDSSDNTKNPGNATLAHVHQNQPADGQYRAILQQSGNVVSANVDPTKVSLSRPAINVIFACHQVIEIPSLTLINHPRNFT